MQSSDTLLFHIRKIIFLIILINLPVRDNCHGLAQGVLPENENSSCYEFLSIRSEVLTPRDYI